MPKGPKEKQTDHKKRDHHGRKVPSIARNDTAMKRFAKNIDVDAMKVFLADSDAEKHQALFAMMGDPAYKGLTFQLLARKAGLTLQDLQSIYTDGMRHIGMIRMMNHLPAIMEDVAEDARTTMVPCTRCDAVGFVPFGDKETRKCPTCDGKKYVRHVGDKHARDLVFESAKLTGNKGPLVAIQNNFDMGDTKMESMLKRTRAIVLDSKPQSVLGSSSQGEPNVNES